MKRLALVVVAWCLIAGNSWAWQIDDLRKEYEALEQQGLKLAEKLRQSKGGDEASQQELAELVRQSFEARQKLQRAQVAESAQRIEKVRQMIEAREGLKTQIVKRRVGELLKANVDASPVASPDVPTAVSNVGKDDKKEVTGIASIDRSTVKPYDLLQISPSQMRSLLRERIKDVLRLRSDIQQVRDRISKEGETEDLLVALKDCEKILRTHEKEYRFVMLQYYEIIKYLERSVVVAMQRSKVAKEQYARTLDLYNQGLIGQAEAAAAADSPRELELELQRAESLLKVYQAAGEDMQLQPEGS